MRWKNIALLLLFLLLLLIPAQKAEAALSLGPVEGFSAQSRGGHALLYWCAEPAASGYRIIRSGEDGHRPRVIFLEDGNTSRWTDPESAAGSLYRYEIEAYRLAEQGRIYGEKRDLLIRVAPDPVCLVSAVNNGEGADLCWQAARGADSYVIFRSGEDGTVELATVGDGVLSYSDHSALPGDSYVYSVSASCFWGSGERILAKAPETGITVYPNLERLEISGKDRMKPGQSWPISVGTFPAESDETLLWSSSDESVAVVRDGMLCGLKDGTAVITVSGERSGVTQSFSVRVDSR